jgi:hypothetical protein
MWTTAAFPCGMVVRLVVVMVQIQLAVLVDAKLC